MIAQKRLVPIWLRVPGHADLAAVEDVDLVEEVQRRGYVVTHVGRDVELPGLTVYADRWSCARNGETVALGIREHAVLLLLAQAHPRRLTNKQIIHRVWGPGYGRGAFRTTAYLMNRKLGKLVVSEHGYGQGRASYGLDLDAAPPVAIEPPPERPWSDHRHRSGCRCADCTRKRAGRLRAPNFSAPDSHGPARVDGVFSNAAAQRAEVTA